MAEKIRSKTNRLPKRINSVINIANGGFEIRVGDLLYCDAYGGYVRVKSIKDSLFVEVIGDKTFDGQAEVYLSHISFLFQIDPASIISRIRKAELAIAEDKKLLKILQSQRS